MTIVADTDIHIGDRGTTFICTIKDDDIVVPLTSGSNSGSYLIGFKKPDKVEIWVEASLYTDGLDGKIKYKVIDEDFFDKAGTWYITAWVEVGEDNYTATAKAFKVRSNFET